jgi:hypothetical protein
MTANLLTINVDKFEQELRDQELYLSEDQWLSIIESLKRATVKPEKGGLER